MVSSCTPWIRRYDVWVGFTPHNTSQRCKLRRPPNGASRKSCQAHTVSGLLARTAGCTSGRKLCAAFRTLTAAAVAFQFLSACPLIINSELHHGSIAPAVQELARVHVHEGHGATTLAGSGVRATQVFIKVIPSFPHRIANFPIGSQSGWPWHQYNRRCPCMPPRIASQLCRRNQPAAARHMLNKSTVITAGVT